MTKVSDIYGGNWVKAEHLKGQNVTVQIESVGVEEVGDGDDKKKQIVLSFVGMEKRLGVNATNAGTIGALYGDEIEAWAGKPITLFPTTCQMNAKTVDCIRVRPVAPGGTAPVSQPAPEPEPTGPVSF